MVFDRYKALLQEEKKEKRMVEIDIKLCLNKKGK